MRHLLHIALLLIFAKAYTPCTAQQPSSPLIDTVRINAMRDSAGNRILQVFDVDMLSKCLQVKQIESIGGFSLLKTNTPLRDTIAVFSESYGTDILVHSFIKSEQFWPKVIFNPTRLTKDIGSATKNPAVGFDVSFTPYSRGNERKFAIEIGNQATPKLLNDTQLNKLKAVTRYGVKGQFPKLSPDAKDSVNASLFRGIATLRGFWEQELSKSNIRSVTFTPTATPSYGFDTEPSDLLKTYYERMVFRGRAYNVPWKSLEAGRMDDVIARISLADSRQATHEVNFRSEKSPSPVVKPNGDGTFTLSLTGGSNKDEEVIEAFYTDTLPGGKTKETVVGKLKVKTYSPTQKKVIPVILNGAPWSMSTTELALALNEIYKQAAVSWTVAEPLRVSMSQNEWDVDEADGVLLIETSLLHRYSTEMQAIIDKVKAQGGYDSEACYAVITELPNSEGYQGYMPLDSDFSFIFTQSNPDYKHVVPHELGHGVFCLKHPQDEYKILDATNNLMDKYSPGMALWKPQWDWITDPSWRLYAFQSEEEGAIINCDNIISYIRNFIKNLNYKLGSETMFSNELLEKYLKTKDGDKYKYQQYLINIKSEINYLVRKNIQCSPINEGATYGSDVGIVIGSKPGKTISDVRLSLFHEYLHKVNDVGKFFPIKKTEKGWIYTEEYTIKKEFIFKSEDDVDKIIKEGGVILKKLVLKARYGTTDNYKPELHDDIVKYLLSERKVTVEYTDIYKPSNFIRDELSVYHWCLEYGDSFGGLSKRNREFYEEYIRKYKDDIERFKLYEENNDLTEEGEKISKVKKPINLKL